MPRHLSPSVLSKASHELHRKPLKLRRDINKEREEHGYLDRSLFARYHQVGALSVDGALPASLPAPIRAIWYSDARLWIRIHTRHHPNRLAEMEKNWSESELDDKFGLLAGEEQVEDISLVVELGAEEFLTWKRRCMEDMHDGDYAGGVWREVKALEPVCLDVDWNWDVVGMVMDQKCVAAVRVLRSRMSVCTWDQRRIRHRTANSRTICLSLQIWILEAKGRADGGFNLVVCDVRARVLWIQ
jgi:hypothetical protein